jgi:hypothetical protein
VVSLVSFQESNLLESVSVNEKKNAYTDVIKKRESVRLKFNFPVFEKKRSDFEISYILLILLIVHIHLRAS